MKTQLLCFLILVACAFATQDSVNPPKVGETKVDSTDHKPVNSTGGKDTVKNDEEQKKVAQTKAPEIIVSHSSDIKATTPKTSTDVSSENHQDGVEVSDSMFNATKRAAYLLTGVSVLVVLYFIWKSYRLKRRQTHIHKYGVVASREDLEMASLGFGSEDEDDDTTHFDIGKHQRS